MTGGRRRTLSAAVPALILAAALPGCGAGDHMLHKTQLFAMGTLVDISIWTRDAERARRGVTAVTRVLNDADHRWHAWKPSALTRINERIAAGEPAVVDPETADLIKKSMAFSAASDGLFNPAIGKLIGLWGFHSDDRPDEPPPPQARIDALLAQAPTMAALHFEGGRLYSANPNVQLDLGGVAKGYAVALAVNTLLKMGIGNAVVDAGGDLRAVGRHGNRPWRIGIRDPRRSGVIASIESQGDESIFTSGDYERYFTYQGKRYHHIIDPRTGYSSVGAASATVIDQDAAKADAAATALMVAGPDKWQSTARSMGLTYVMLVDHAGTVYMSPAMATRIRFEASPAPKVVIGSL